MYCVIVFLICCIAFFLFKDSTLYKEFNKDKELFSKNKVCHMEERQMPISIQKYLEHTNLLEMKGKTRICMKYSDVSFHLNKKGNPLKMTCTQYNFSNSLTRIAYMKTSMFGIPFEGYDSFKMGKGSMQGVLAKGIRLFNQTGKEMDKASLATILAESLFLPNLMYSSFTSYEQINEMQVRGVLKYKDLQVSGIFTFNEKNEMISFETNDRAQTDNQGQVKYMPWMARCEQYEKDGNILRPKHFQAVWLEEKEFVYFDGMIDQMDYE